MLQPGLLAGAATELKQDDVIDELIELNSNTPTDYFTEVSLGNIPGRSMFTFTGSKPVITTSFETTWDIAGNFTWPTGDEAWEIGSDDTDDTSAGTGARTVIIVGLDTNFDTQTEIVTMNGTTFVDLVRTDWNRINDIFVLTSGSSEANEGTITLRVDGGGLTRATIRPTLARSFNGFFTVPNGKIAVIQQTEALTPKGEDITIRNLVRSFGSNTFISAGDAPMYQSEVLIPFVAKAVIGPKTDLEGTTKSSNASVNGSVFVELLLVDVEEAPNAVFSRSM